MSRGTVALTRIQWKGRLMTPVIYVADNLITLLPPRYARRLKNAGTVGIVSEEEWNVILSDPGSRNLDPQYTGA